MNISYFIFESNIQEDRKVRADKIKKELSKIDSIKSDTIMISSKDDLANHITDFSELQFDSKMRLGAIGLLFGTINLYKTALSNNTDYLIVFEDDFIIGKNFYKNVIDILNQEKIFDVMSLYAFIPFSKNYVFPENITNDLVVNADGYPWIPKAYSYIISRSGMEKFIKYVYSNICQPIDVLLFNEAYIKDFKRYCINPKLLVLGSIDNTYDDGHTIGLLSNITDTEMIGKL
jgi:hypothetical protein